ncbi:hypothetical protein [Nocardiopsis valliformis]|uniref:hypothetical protein n=1 Tax=Nocardiopsis valliformis TaxID=239974 RepID=UPI00146D77A1|nr:hypothetical protein [Nocardiopsis valliformis]
MTPHHASPVRARRRARFAERPQAPAEHSLPLGTNGYTSSWGHNAHGELSACPPGHG